MKRTLRDRLRILPWVGHVILAAGLLASVAVAQVSVIGGSTAPLSCDGTNCTMASGQLLLPDSVVAIARSADSTDGISFAADQILFQVGTTVPYGVFTDGLRIRIGQSIHFVPASPHTSSPDLSLTRGGTTGALRIHAGTTPTVSGCGAGATIAGNNSLGTVTIGTTPGTCVVTSHGTWANIPKCHLNNRTSAQLARATANSTTTFTISGTLTAGDDIDYMCLSS